MQKWITSLQDDGHPLEITITSASNRHQIYVDNVCLAVQEPQIYCNNIDKKSLVKQGSVHLLDVILK